MFPSHAALVHHDLAIAMLSGYSNETANVHGSGIAFVAELRRVPGDEFDVSDAAQAAAGPIGRTRRCFFGSTTSLAPSGRAS